MAKLVIRSGPQVGSEFSVDRPSVRLGRGSGSDIVLQSTQSSRQHAEISRQGDQYYIRDLGSTNGTFVNNQQVTGSQPLRPGDQVRIGDIVLAFDAGVAAGVTMAAGAGAATDWEAELWDDDYGTAGGQDSGRKLLVWGLVGVAILLLLGAGVGAALLLRGDGASTPLADTTASPTSAIVVASPTPQGAAQPTDSSLVDLPTVQVDPIPTIDVDTEAVESPAPPAEVPAAVPAALPKAPPVSPENLEQLPAMITQFLGDVSPEQLPQVISEQMGNMSQEQVQTMIGTLFPGVDPAQLPQVVAASFPELPQSEIKALLGQAFPGMDFQLPEMGGPVGGRLVLGIYDSNRKTSDLYVVNAMGGEPTLLIESASEPDVAHDGQWVVYDSWASDRLGLRLIKIDGTQDTELTTSKQDSNPFFSPDGQRISFFNYEHSVLHVINRDGSDRRDFGKGQYPAWSPTGDQIVYRGCIGGGKCGLIVSRVDGSNPIQVTTHANDAAPRWSPNGGQIVFYSDRDGNWEIYVINSDGSWLRRVTNHAASDVMPVWSPDGLRIAFRSDRGGTGAVWVTSGVGGLATKLIDAPLHTDWQTAQMDWIK